MSHSQTTIEISQAIQSVRLILVDPKSNHNKTWSAWLFPNHEIYVEWGRVGYKCQGCRHVFYSSHAAQAKLNSLLQEKRAKGYQEAEVEKELKPQLNWSVAEGKIRSIFQAIQTQATEIEKIAPLIRFDEQRGAFMTSLGAISKTTIASAKTVLRQVRIALKIGDLQRHAIAVGQYLALIPLQVGMKLIPQQVLGQPEQIQQQVNLLQLLESCLTQIEEIRGQIQQAIAEKAAWVWSDRSFWVEWGAEDQTSEINHLLDDRSLHVAWD